jgi:tryptophan-rich sensory protein
LYAAAAFGAAWTADRFIFLGPFLNAYFIAVAGLLFWPLCRMLRRSRAAWYCALLAALFVLAGLANRLWMTAFCRYYHFTVRPDWQPPLLLSHPMWTATELLACASLLHWLHRQLMPASPTES